MFDLSDPKAVFRYGKAIAVGGDIDRDGHPDLLVTEYADMFACNESRQLRVYSGASGALLRRHGFEGFRADESGRSVAWIGDIDADGVQDHAAGGSNADATSLIADGVTAFSGAKGKVLLVIP